MHTSTLIFLLKYIRFISLILLQNTNQIVSFEYLQGINQKKELLPNIVNQFLENFFLPHYRLSIQFILKSLNSHLSNTLRLKLIFKLP